MLHTGKPTDAKCCRGLGWKNTPVVQLRCSSDALVDRKYSGDLPIPVTDQLLCNRHLRYEENAPPLPTTMLTSSATDPAGAAARMAKLHWRWAVDLDLVLVDYRWSVGQTKHVHWALTSSGLPLILGSAPPSSTQRLDNTERQDQLLSLILVWRQQTANNVWNLPACLTNDKQL